MTISHIELPWGGQSYGRPAQHADHRGPVVFVDTEFTTSQFHHSPWLLSLGMVCADGREFYAEIEVDNEHRERCTDFVLKEVLPQFGKLSGRSMSPGKLAKDSAQWLSKIGGTETVLIVYTCEWDLDFLDVAVRNAGGISCKLAHLEAYQLLNNEASKAEMATSLSRSEKSQGLKAHHALADARALRAGFPAGENPSAKENLAVIARRVPPALARASFASSAR